MPTRRIILRSDTLKDSNVSSTETKTQNQRILDLEKELSSARNEIETLRQERDELLDKYNTLMAEYSDSKKDRNQECNDTVNNIDENHSSMSDLEDVRTDTQHPQQVTNQPTHPLLNVAASSSSSNNQNEATFTSSPSGFQLFSASNHASYRSQYPNMNSRQLNEFSRSIYDQLPQQVKSYWEGHARRERERYNHALTTLTPPNTSLEPTYWFQPPHPKTGHFFIPSQPNHNLLRGNSNPSPGNKLIDTNHKTQGTAHRIIRDINHPPLPPPPLKSNHSKTFTICSLCGARVRRRTLKYHQTRSICIKARTMYAQKRSSDATLALASNTQPKPSIDDFRSFSERGKETDMELLIQQGLEHGTVFAAILSSTWDNI